MKRSPTDLEILNVIYDKYYDKFSSFDNTSPTRSSKIYVPIDLADIARRLRVDVDIVFGRLYYDLEKRYGYRQDNEAWVHFFALKAGNDTHCVNFPYLASVLSNLRRENRKYRVATTVSFTALVVSITSLLVSILLKAAAH